MQLVEFCHHATINRWSCLYAYGRDVCCYPTSLVDKRSFAPLALREQNQIFGGANVSLTNHQASPNSWRHLRPARTEDHFNGLIDGTLPDSFAVITLQAIPCRRRLPLTFDLFPFPAGRMTDAEWPRLACVFCQSGRQPNPVMPLQNSPLISSSPAEGIWLVDNDDFLDRFSWVRLWCAPPVAAVQIAFVSNWLLPLLPPGGAVTRVRPAPLVVIRRNHCGERITPLDWVI